MRQLTYTDKEGKHYEVLIPDDAPDSEASKGVVIGPPNLILLDLPNETAIRLHNQLHSRGILTLKDALSRRQELYNALIATYRADVEAVLAAINEGTNGR